MKITQKSKMSCTIKAVKNGNAMVQATVKGKKYKCKVTVVQPKKTKKTKAPENTNNPMITKAPEITNIPETTATVVPTVEPTKNPDGIIEFVYGDDDIDDIINCTEPFSLKINEGVETIYYDSFEELFNTNMVSVTNIENCALSHCKNLKIVLNW